MLTRTAPNTQRRPSRGSDDHDVDDDAAPHRHGRAPAPAAVPAPGLGFADPSGRPHRPPPGLPVVPERARGCRQDLPRQRRGGAGGHGGRAARSPRAHAPAQRRQLRRGLRPAQPFLRDRAVQGVSRGPGPASPTSPTATARRSSSPGSWPAATAPAYPATARVPGVRPAPTASRSAPSAATVVATTDRSRSGSVAAATPPCGHRTRSDPDTLRPAARPGRQDSCV